MRRGRFRTLDIRGSDLAGQKIQTEDSRREVQLQTLSIFKGD